MSDYMNETITLMFGDTEVLRFNFRGLVCKVLNEKYLPYYMRGKLKEVHEAHDGMSRIEASILSSNMLDNTDVIKEWFAHRTLSLSRSNAKKIFDLLDFPQLDSIQNRYKLAVTCRAVSVLDKYWVRFDDTDNNISWDAVDIKRNSLNKIIAQVALHGDALTFQGSYNTPEITTNGIFAKAWRRHNDGVLWLHKLSLNGGIHSKVEVSVSKILDKCNVSHVHYEGGEDCGEYVCMCPCMTNDKYSVVSAHEYRRYCSENDIDFIEEVIRIDHDNYHKMHIVDYLIGNLDRHAHNWGFFENNETMELEMIHPLFDHNNAFDPKLMPNNRNIVATKYNSMKHMAEFGMEEVDFHFTAPITREDFIDGSDGDKHYDMFMTHAEELGVKTIQESNPFVNAVSKMEG